MTANILECILISDFEIKLNLLLRYRMLSPIKQNQAEVCLESEKSNYNPRTNDANLGNICFGRCRPWRAAATDGG